MTEPVSDRRLVLLIDDDDVVIGTLRQYLLAHGCDVDVAVAPPAAEAMMRARRYDVVLLDPYFTGAIHDDGSVLESIAALQPRAATIVLTAYASPELARLIAATPAISLLTKPQSVVLVGDLVAGRAADRSAELTSKGLPI